MHIDSTEGTLKKNNHNTPLNLAKYKNSTRLTIYVWEIKGKEKQSPIVKWVWMKKSYRLSLWSKVCRLCQVGKSALVADANKVYVTEYKIWNNECTNTQENFFCQVMDRGRSRFYYPVTYTWNRGSGKVWFLKIIF